MKNLPFSRWTPFRGLSAWLPLAMVAVLLTSRTCVSQDRTWALTTSDVWNNSLNWDPADFPNTLGESATLGGLSSYSVLFDIPSTVQIGGLSITNSNAELVILPDSANTLLTIATGFTNNGTISLNSNSTRNAGFTVASGLLSNVGTINFGGTSSNSASLRRLSADVLNSGIVNVIQNAQLSRINGVFTNNGAVNIASGKTLDFDGVNGTFNQDSGTVANSGSFEFFADTLNFNGGSFVGNAIEMEDSTLSIGVGSTGTGSFNMKRTGFYSGNLAAAQTLNLLDGTTNTSITATEDFTNFGMINLNSDSTRDVTFSRAGTITNAGTINFGGTSSDANTFRRLSANVVNNGIVNVDQNAQLNRINGVFTNSGTVNIAAGKTLDFDGVSGTFNQDSGTVNNSGSFDFLADTLNFNGGSFAGNAIEMDGSTLNIGVGSTGAGTFNMKHTGFYSGDLAAAQTLNLLGGPSNTSITATGDFTNFGTINLNSDSTRNATLSRDGTITNLGTISFGGSSTDANTLRRLSADVVNGGIVNVDQNAQLNRINGIFTNNGTVNIAAGKTLDFDGINGTFNQDSGTVNNSGSFDFLADTLNFNGGSFTGDAIELDGSTLNIGVGSTGTGTFNMKHTGFYSGDLSAAQTLNVFDGTSITSITATADFINFGTINLDSDSTRNVALSRAGTITNSGTIRIGGTSTDASTIRRLSASLVNNGIIDIVALGVSTEIGRSGAVHSNAGLIVSRETGSVVKMIGSSFTNEVGGTLAGVGEFDFSQAGVFTNHGAISPGLSAGLLTIDGDFTLSSTSSIILELGGLVQGSEYDFLNGLDAINLGGSLDVSFIDDFENSITSFDTFTVMSANALNGTFDGIADGAVLTLSDGKGRFTVNYAGNSVVLSNFSAVPEPTSTLLLIGLAAGFFGTRRRRIRCS